MVWKVCGYAELMVLEGCLGGVGRLSRGYVKVV